MWLVQKLMSRLGAGRGRAPPSDHPQLRVGARPARITKAAHASSNTVMRRRCRIYNAMVANSITHAQFIWHDKLRCSGSGAVRPGADLYLFVPSSGCLLKHL